MLEIGAIGRSDYETAEAEPIRLPKPELPGTRAPYFMDFVRRVLEEAIGPQRLYQGGLTITTSLDSGLQAAAEAAVAEGLAKLEDRRDPAGKLQPPQAAAVAIDVATGGILAMVGGRGLLAKPLQPGHRRPAATGIGIQTDALRVCDRTGHGPEPTGARRAGGL